MKSKESQQPGGKESILEGVPWRDGRWSGKKAWDSNDVSHFADEDSFPPFNIIEGEPTSFSLAFSLRPAAV